MLLKNQLTNSMPWSQNITCPINLVLRFDHFVKKKKKNEKKKQHSPSTKSVITSLIYIALILSKFY